MLIDRQVLPGRLIDPAEAAKAADDLVEQLTDARDHHLKVHPGAIRELTARGRS